MNIPNKLMNAEEVAGILGINKQTIYRYIRQRSFPVTRIGTKAIRVSKGQLEKWLAKNSQEAA